MGYKVQKGDGWYRIAKNTGMDVNELLRLNNATLNTVIHPGQEIKTNETWSMQSGFGTLVPKKKQSSNSMPAPYRSDYTKEQFIRDNARSIQEQLVKAGYDLGKYGENKDGIDGKWGKTSQAALDKALADGYKFENGKLSKTSLKPRKPEAQTIQEAASDKVGEWIDNGIDTVKGWFSKPETKTDIEPTSKTTKVQSQFIPYGYSQGLVQRASKSIEETDTEDLNTTGSAFYISYPEHPISTGGTPLRYVTPTVPLGHSASIIMDADGKATYHTYGRYGDKGSYITKALPSMRKEESKQAYLERIRPHLEYANKNEPVKATYVSEVDSTKSRQYYKDEPQKGNYGFIVGSTCVGEACNGINAGRNFSKGELLQYITPNTPDLQHTLYGNETYHF